MAFNVCTHRHRNILDQRLRLPDSDRPAGCMHVNTGALTSPIRGGTCEAMPLATRLGTTCCTWSPTQSLTCVV